MLYNSTLVSDVCNVNQTIPQKLRKVQDLRILGFPVQSYTANALLLCVITFMLPESEVCNCQMLQLNAETPVGVWLSCNHQADSNLGTLCLIW